MTDPEAWDTYARSTGVVRNQFDEKFGDMEARRAAAKSYAEWFRTMDPTRNDGAGAGGGLFDFEIDPWTQTWEPAPPPEAIAVDPAVDPAFGGGGGGRGGGTIIDKNFWEEWRELQNMVRDLGTTPEPLPAAEDNRDDMMQMLMGMMYGGQGNEPPPSPYGFGTIYGGY